MGLIVSHGCWPLCSYRSFRFWRERLGLAAGYTVSEGYLDLDYDNITEANIFGDWETDPEDILVVLLAHSDWNGVIRNYHLIPLAIRLLYLRESLDIEWDKWALDNFVNGLEIAYDLGEDVLFH